MSTCLVLVCTLARGASGQTAAATPPRFWLSDGQIIALLQALPVANGKALAPLVNSLLSDTASHMRMATRRVATGADSTRAADVVRTVRASLGSYQDVALAERDGYVRFLPWLEDQSVYHYNHVPNAIASTSNFDVTKPTSLLYRKTETGALKLVGAMYTAPASASMDELDARLPLGFAYWHQHVNFCGMGYNQAASVAQQADSAIAARWLKIETREACAEAGGFFLPNLFGWMAHLNVFDADSPSAIWGHEGRNHMHMHQSH